MNGEKLRSLLQSKSELLDNIGGLIHEQATLLENGRIKEVSAKCDEVNSILRKLETVSGRIASLESSADSSSLNHADDSLRHLYLKIIRQAEGNRILMDNLVERALKNRDDIKQKLDDTVTGTRITGYKPFSGKRPVYFDKRN